MSTEFDVSQNDLVLTGYSCDGYRLQLTQTFHTMNKEQRHFGSGYVHIDFNEIPNLIEDLKKLYEEKSHV